jgi:nucleotide-binding universal stress UspA family protein
MGRRPHLGEKLLAQDRAFAPWRLSAYDAILAAAQPEEARMRGTLVCAITEGDESVNALELGADLSTRLGLRLVVAYAIDGIAALGSTDGMESVSMKGDRQGAERRLARLVEDHGLAGVERRIAVGEPAALLGEIAAEEAADLIVVGSRARGPLRRRLESRLARQLEDQTPVPVLIAPPRTRRAGKSAS